ncbi:glycoside hydrolase family 78 protein [Paenibacillus cymbidii]|uniref:glycoside hydrolase family 78 protein n=1 Tax=Paenibacillus cymbidii TaxID=1639034 RepID=UPI001080C1A5|nr:PKD domain-containing protein [Paenibacillus cymbidii]
MTTNCAVSPTSVVNYTSGNVLVAVTVGPSTLNNPPAAPINGWRADASYSGGKGSQSSSYASTSASGGSKTLNLTIAAADIDLSSQPTQTLTIDTKATVYTSGGNYETSKSCTLTITKDSSTPSPAPTATPTPTSTPTPTPPSCSTPATAAINGPSSAKQGAEVYFSGSGSKQNGGGTNLSYQWYYGLQDGSGNVGSLITGPIGRDVIITFDSIGTYRVWLGVTDLDKPACGAQTNMTLQIKSPGPDASILVTGDKKEKRPMVLDGSGSSTPAAFPITSRTFTVTPVSAGVTAADIVTIGSLSGTTRLDVMFRKPGDFKAAYTVCNAIGCDTAEKTFTIAPDQLPVAVLDTAAKVYRDPDNDNKITFNLSSDSYSPDSDTLGTLELTGIYDADNDGSWLDEDDRMTINMNMVTGKATAEATQVGHYLFAFRVRETFDPGPFAAYIHDSDYLWSDVTFAEAEADNQAPTTGLNASKEYKADIYVNIGNLSAAEQNYFRNNINTLKTTLQANQVKANIKTSTWDPIGESDYLKDSNTKLNHDMSWSNPVDHKYFVGATNTLAEQGSIGPPVAPLALALNQYPTSVQVGSTTQALFPKVGPNPTVINYDYAPNKQWSLQKDSKGNPFILEIEDTGDQFRHKYQMISSSMGSFPLVGAFNGLNQIVGHPSYVNGEWVIWSAEGIYYFDTYQQQANYFRKASNHYAPTTSPDNYVVSSGVVDTYVDGYNVGSNTYWFGAQGTVNTQYLGYRYNGSLRTMTDFYPQIYDAEVVGDKMVIIANKITGNVPHKITLQIGNVISSEALTGAPTGYPIRYSINQNKIYAVGYDKRTVTAYDMTSKTVLWTKTADVNVSFMDIGLDYDGQPIYLFKHALTSTVLYISKEGAASSGTTNIMNQMTQESIPPNAISYNTQGDYSWFNSYQAYYYANDCPYGGCATTTKGTVIQVHKMDRNGKETYKAFPAADGTFIFATYTYEDGNVAIFGVTNNKIFYALEEEHYQIKFALESNPYFSPNQPNLRTYRDKLGRPYLLANGGVYYFDKTTGKFGPNLATHYASSEMGLYITDDQQVKSNALSGFWQQYGTNNMYQLDLNGKIVRAGTTESVINNYSMPSYASGSLDYDKDGYYAATITIVDDSYTYRTYFYTNRPEFVSQMEVMHPTTANTPSYSLYGSDGTQTNGMAIYGKNNVRVKFGADNNLYVYAGTGPAAIYRLNPGVAYTGSLTRTGAIMNSTVSIKQFIGNTEYVASAGYTNLPAAKPQPPIPSYLVDQTVGATKDDLIYDSGNYQNNRIEFDSSSNSYSRLKYNGTTDAYDFTFFNPGTKSYARTSLPKNGLAIEESLKTFRNGAYLYMRYNGSAPYSIYKTTRNGTSLVDTITGVSLYSGISSIQDDAGYTYTVYSTSTSTWNGSSYVTDFITYLRTNRSGTFVTMQLLPTNGCLLTSKLFLSGGYIAFTCNGYSVALQGYSGQVFRYIKLSDLSTGTATSTLLTQGLYNITNIAYDGKNFFAVGQYNVWVDDWGQNVYYPGFISTALNQRLPGYSFLLDDYDLYLVGSGMLYRFNKADMTLLDAGWLPAVSYPQSAFPLKAKGKVIYLSSDNNGNVSVKAAGAIDMSQNDPAFVNTVGGQNIRTIFTGPSSIWGAVQTLVKQSGGTYLPYTSAAAALDDIAAYIAADIKQSDPSGGALYFLQGDSVDFAGVYQDYESDPMQAGKFRFTHDPNVFDNNQGTVPESGQDIETPLSGLNKVGMYTVYFRAQDDPTQGNAAVNPYAKWSAIPADPLTFYVHRRPIAHFSVVLRDNPANPLQATATIKEDSYDADHSITMATTTKGIAAKAWKWKLAADTEWTDGTLPSPLAKNTTYMLSLTVTDIEGADSMPYTISFDTGPANITPNHPPVVTITNPASADPTNPTIVSTTTPTFEWTYTDAENDPQVKYELYVYNSSNTQIYDSGWVTSVAQTRMMPAYYLTDGQTYSVQVKANDGYADSAPAAKKYFKIVLNQPPSADVTNPSGTAKATATIVSTTTPTIQWSQTDPDAGTVFKGYEVQITNEANTLTWTSAGWSSNVAATSSGAMAQNTSAPAQSWAVHAAMPLAGGQYYRVRVRVQDDKAVWSNWSTQKWMYINRPPTAAFDWTPKPAWEGDTVMIASQSSDPDGDPLSYVWAVEKPDGGLLTGAAPTLVVPAAAPGAYKTTLTVSDGRTTASALHTIDVLPLTIQADVRHTPEWLANHEALGHVTTGRPQDFYSGERLVLSAASAPAPVEEATARLQATGADGTPYDLEVALAPDSSGYRFDGELFDERMLTVPGRLPNGVYQIRFRLRYANGIVKTEDVPITIIGSIHEYVGVHRVR